MKWTNKKSGRTVWFKADTKVCFLKAVISWQRELDLVVYLIILFYGISTLFGSFNAQLSHFDKSFQQFNSV